MIHFPLSYCSCNLSRPTGDNTCSSLFCLNDCSNKGICNFETGLCECESFYTGIDCSIIIIEME